MYTYKNVEIDRITKLRKQYLDSLFEPQELYIELMVTDAEKHIIQSGGTDVGYFIKRTDNYIIEFYLEDKYLPDYSKIFKEIIKNQQLKGAYCKSFDSVLLKACLHIHKSVKIIGVLYRDITNIDIHAPNRIDEIRTAKMTDFEDIVSIKEEVFDTDDEVEYTIKKDAVFVFKNNGKLIGYGIFQPAIEGRNSYDIGMAVSPEYRKKGYGAYILNYLKNHCINNNWSPTCGCAIENIASQKTIEKIGFVSKHNMLEFSF